MPRIVVSFVLMAFSVLVLLGGIGLLILEALDKVDSLRKRFPRFVTFIEKRESFNILFMVCALLLVGNGFELVTKEVPELPKPPIVTLQGPVISVPSSQAVSGGREPKDSLRRRTMLAADELYDYLKKRAAEHPPVAYPNSNDPNPSEERKKAIQICQKYDQETLDYYLKHFKDRMVGIIKEYESKGVPTHYLENDFKQRVPGAMAIGSDWEGSSMDELSQFRDLAYHVDARDHLIVF